MPILYDLMLPTLKGEDPDFEPLQKSVEIIEKFKSTTLIKSAYLFGSGATNKMTIDSGLDLLLIFATGEQLKVARAEIIHSEQNIAIDWIFKTEDDFEKEKNFGGVSYEAFNFGKKIK